MSTPTKRAPILSDRDIEYMRNGYEFLFSGHAEKNREAWEIGALDMRDRYEAKITSGELRVVVKAENVGAEFVCSSCRIYLCDATMRQGDNFTSTVNFCPSCGAQIVK